MTYEFNIYVFIPKVVEDFMILVNYRYTATVTRSDRLFQIIIVPESQLLFIFKNIIDGFKFKDCGNRRSIDLISFKYIND